MIRNFKESETELISLGERSRRFPPDIQPKALKLLRLMATVQHWTELRFPPGNNLHALSRDRAGQYAIRINDQWRIAFRPVDGACADVEITDITRPSLSSDPEDWLPNPHAGEMLKTEFLDPIPMTVAAIAQEIGLPEQRISEVIEGTRPIDAELDLRLARYFGMSDGFFLRLETEYQVLEERRRLGSELDRIVPRAA